MILAKDLWKLQSFLKLFTGSVCVLYRYICLYSDYIVASI